MAAEQVPSSPLCRARGALRRQCEETHWKRARKLVRCARMGVLNLQLLGDLQIRGAAEGLAPIRARKSQALLAYLGARTGHPSTRDKLAALLWSSTATEQGRQSLRQTLSGLRKELSQVCPTETVLIEDGDLLSLDPAVVRVDSAEFEALIATGTEEGLMHATKLYRGDFLEGFVLAEDRFDQWVLAERDRLHRLALRAHSHLVEMQERRGDTDSAIDTAQRSLRIDLLQENVHRSLMRMYGERGDLISGLQQYETLAKTLKRELNIEPDAETRQMQKDLFERRARSSSSSASTQPQKKNVLVVEDNLLNRELTNALLKSAGYSVMLAKDGAEALLIVGREPVDLLILDVDLPFLDGHSVLQALKENGVDLPAIFVSGVAGEEAEVRAFELGAADFIRKPVRNAVLLARVAKVLKA